MQPAPHGKGKAFAVVTTNGSGDYYNVAAVLNEDPDEDNEEDCTEGAIKKKSSAMRNNLNPKEEKSVNGNRSQNIINLMTKPYKKEQVTRKPAEELQMLESVFLTTHH